MCFNEQLSILIVKSSLTKNIFIHEVLVIRLSSNTAYTILSNTALDSPKLVSRNIFKHLLTVNPPISKF